MRRLAWVLACSTALAVGLAFLPAAWLAAAVNRWALPSGRVMLVDPQGTAWRGHCLVAFSDGRQALALPGRFGWQLSPLTLLRGAIRLEIRHPALAQPVKVEADASGWRVAAGRARLAAEALVAIGAPFNTLRPQGPLELTWDTLAGAPRDPAQGFRGQLTVLWRDAASSLTPLRPIGSYRLVLTGQGSRTAIALSTVHGPLELQGQGSWSAASGLRFDGQATASPAALPQLNGLLSLLGRRAGDRAIIKLET